MLASLTDEQADSFAESVLRRFGGLKDLIDVVLADLRRPATSGLNRVPRIFIACAPTLEAVKTTAECVIAEPAFAG
eukprot:2157458-Lingulodinium_polyedra.AAC.1